MKSPRILQAVAGTLFGVVVGVGVFCVPSGVRPTIFLGSLDPETTDEILIGARRVRFARRSWRAFRVAARPPTS